MTHDGLPGTSMPAWKGVLPAEDIRAVTAYIMTLAKNPLASANAVVSIEGAEEGPQTLTGEAKRGEELFFDLTRENRCGVCHQLRHEDTAFGFELTEATTRAGCEPARGAPRCRQAGSSFTPGRRSRRSWPS